MIRLLVCSLVLIGFLEFSNVTKAQEAEDPFFLRGGATYEVVDNSTVHVLYDISLTNAGTDDYASSFTLKLDGVNPKNVASFSGRVEHETFVIPDELGGVSLKIVFSDAVVGEGETRRFTIEFDDTHLINRTGEVWEVSVPQFKDTNRYLTFTTKFIIPKVYGIPAYITPEPNQTFETENAREYAFEKDTLKATGAVIAFGEFQVYSFEISYRLENPVVTQRAVELALPPDTSLQRVFIEALDPKPVKMKADEDGNWIATYALSGRERMDIKVIGKVQVFLIPLARARPDKDYLIKMTQPNEYWEVDNPAIESIVSAFTDAEEIYNYVIELLNYDVERAKPNVIRKGAVKSLESPESAICMEFTDLFITLARAAGIPAREVNGYAYTDNPDLQPLSLVSDVLHAWPQYWSEERGAWIDVDPTWGHTTGGVDYFNQLDMRHVAFVIHGVSSTKPFPPGSYKLGPNPQKDVFISISKLPESRETVPEVTMQLHSTLPFRPIFAEVHIINPGPQALSADTLYVSYDDVPSTEVPLPPILPFEERNIRHQLPRGLFAQNTPENVSIFYKGQRIDQSTGKATAITRDITTILFLIFLFIGGVYLHVRHGDIFTKVRFSNKS